MEYNSNLFLTSIPDLRQSDKAPRYTSPTKPFKHRFWGVILFRINFVFGYYTDASASYKDALTPDFFVLSTRIAGEILQKFINYQFKFAIVGDFSGYTSKPLKDFIYESNKGRDIFFVSSEEDAIEKLSRT